MCKELMVDCPGGCSVRLPVTEIVQMIKHVQRAHPSFLMDFLKDQGIYEGVPLKAPERPEDPRTLILVS